MTGAYDPHGAAVVDCFRGDASAVLIRHQDGARDNVAAAFWHHPLPTSTGSSR
jgi:hypothetical protein